MQSVMDAAELEALLGRFMDGTQIRQAEDSLKLALGKPEFMLDLMCRLRQSPVAQVRQLAAVLMRRRIGTHWPRIPPPVRAQTQAALLQQLVDEPERLVRRSTVSVTCAIARHALPAKGGWNELLAFMSASAASESLTLRETSMHLIGSLLEQRRLIDSQRQQGQLRERRSGSTETLAEVVLPAIQQALQALTHGG